MKLRADFAWRMAFAAWAIDLFSLVVSIVMFASVLMDHRLPVFWRGVLAIFAWTPVGISLGFTISNWEGICPWVFRHPPTSKSSLQNLVPSSFQYASQPPSPSSSPSASPFLPSVTIDQPVVGFRTWKLNGTSLLPNGIGSGAPWTATMVAQCLADKKHPAPQPTCTCGLHAWLAPISATWPASGQVSGVVLASGKIYRHTAEQGFRAERMRILGLTRPPLKDLAFEPCPTKGAFRLETMSYTVFSYSSGTSPQVNAPLISENGYYRYGHCWTTEDRELNLPTGTHRFKAKVKCEWCGCGPERETVMRDHAPEVAGLELLAGQFGVPVIPCERVTQYAAEFGIIASEVKALGA